MRKKKFLINDLLDKRRKFDLQLELVAGNEGLSKEVTVGDINRPGLSLSGFYDFFAFNRIQVFGLGETAYLRSISQEARNSVCETFFSYDILCCVFTHSESPDETFLSYSNNNKVPIFITSYRTTRFVNLLTHVIEESFAAVCTIHGTLVEVFGIGVLILGKSGVGKSESALELVERGHRLVADDIVEVNKIEESYLNAGGSDIIKHHMEIRGLGIINVRDIYGIRSVRDQKRIDLVVLLEEWDATKAYDRLGIDEQKYNLLDIDIPYITIPVRPGRNVPIIIETAALNQRLKKMGVFSANELDEKIKNIVRK